MRYIYFLAILLGSSLALGAVVKQPPIAWGSADPTVTAVKANQGSMYMSSGTGKIYVKTDSGLTTNWLPIATAVGSPDTLSYYDENGLVTSSQNLRLQHTNGMVLSSIEAGASVGNVASVSEGPSLVIGTVGGTSSILSTAFGKGNFALGYSLSDAQISAQGHGSIATGYATNSAIIATEHEGSLAMGVADGASSQLSANGTGTMARGYAGAGSTLGAEGAAGTAWGFANTNSVITTDVNSYGAFAGGYANNGGNIATTANGAISYGYADASSSISSQAAGALALGRSALGANIDATGVGSLARGSASAGTIVSSGEGSTAIGKAVIAGTTITASGDGATALGYANNFDILAIDHGAFAFGVAENADIMASGQGSFAGGFPLVGPVQATGVSAFAYGDGNIGSGRLSTTLGYGNTNASYASIVGGRYASVTSTDPTAWTGTDSLFVLGNGTGSGSLSNAFQILKNGATTINGTVQIKDGTQGTAGHVWTSTDVNGNGHWAAAGGGGANQSLSNLTSPTAINQDLTFAAGDGGQVGIISGNATTYWTGANAVYFGGGAPTGNGIYFGSKDAEDDATIHTDYIAFNSGAAPQGSNANNVGSGDVEIDSGDVPLGTAGSGNVYIDTGQTHAGSSGVIDIETGIANSTGVNQTTGMVTLRSGNNNGSGSGATTGNVVIQSGAVNSGGTSGDIILQPGSGPNVGTNGVIDLRGLFKLTRRSSGQTPTCNATYDGVVALTNGYVLCICKNGTGWQQTDGATSCTF